MLIQIKDGKPVGHAVLESNFRQLFPATSFPQFLTAADVEPFGFGMYEFSAQPQPGKYQNIVEVEPQKDQLGIWRQSWSIKEMTVEEKAAADAQQAAFVRAERNRRLSESDWTQLADSTADKDAWAAYRQALRDVPAQAGFPWEVVWPEQPV